MRHPFGTENIVTRQTAVTPAEVANERTCPNWLRFMNEACGFNAEKVQYLQRYAGYALTGDYSEHTFVIIYGQPGTGKSLFTGTLQYVLGEYATVLPASALMKERTQTAASSDIAKLAGPRFALANEFPEGEALDESRIKVLTGGDKITARLNGKDYFEFTQQAKFIATTNHKPRILNPRKGIDRRMLLVEFTQSPSKIDYQLAEKLKNEAAGILRWMMDGLMQLQANRGESESGGLNPPKCILDATNAYLEEEDELGAWLDDCFTLETGAFTTTEMIMQSYTRWSEENGLNKRLHARQLTEPLQARGCIKVKQYATRAPREGYLSGEKVQLHGYQGLKLKDLFYAGL
jgi:putative DNA primase/helicase